MPSTGRKILTMLKNPHLRSTTPRWLAGLLLCPLLALGAVQPADWIYEQTFSVAAPGLLKLSLPPATLDAARPGLEDLRLLYASGAEMPYAIQRPTPAPRVTQAPKSFRVQLTAKASIITLETGLGTPIEGLALQTPAEGFIKAVQLEGSADGASWRPLAKGEAVFQRYQGASRMFIPLKPDSPLAWLRLSVDDSRSAPVPWTGAQFHAAPAEPVVLETITPVILERHETADETRLTVDLGAANLDLATLTFQTSETLLNRQVTVAIPQVREDSIREQTIATGAIYRLAVEGQPTAEDLTLPLNAQATSRQLIVTIRNQDSPPLAALSLTAQRRPAYLLFRSPQAGTYRLLTGNARCPAPRYDIAVLGDKLSGAALVPVSVSTPSRNAAYQPAEVLPGVQLVGAPLDISAWGRRKTLTPSRPGVQQAELDLEILAHANPDFSDLRLIQDGKQVPYLLERTSIRRAITPAYAITNNPKDRGWSGWILTLPLPGLPVDRFSCTTPTSLFQRNLTLSESVSDERGETYRTRLADASWTQTPERRSGVFSQTLNRAPRGNVLLLETHNGDNPPIALDRFQFYYPATRILFKAASSSPIGLYYGNPAAPAPHYDLALVGHQLLAGQKDTLSFSPEQMLKPTLVASRHAQASGSIVLWSCLALVVAGLLILIAKLLPKPPDS
jgi:hypothetical protein